LVTNEKAFLILKQFAEFKDAMDKFYEEVGVGWTQLIWIE
jgi:hypothetical protein